MKTLKMLKILDLIRFLFLVTLIHCSPSTVFTNNSPKITLNVKDFGAKGDGTTLDTKSLQTALTSCSQYPIGCIVFFPPGQYLTGSLNLTSQCVLHLDPKASIVGSTDLNEYTLLYEPLPSYPENWKYNTIPRYSGLIHGENLENVMITGGGTIFGNGRSFWGLKPKYSLSPMVQFINSSTIQLVDITLEESPFWTLHFYASSDVLVERISILNLPGSSHTDGIDVDSTANVVIRDNLISTGDDHIALKSGAQKYGRDFNRPTQNVLITHNRFGIGAGIAIGSEMAGGIQDVIIDHNEMSLSYNLVRIKSCWNYGGIVQNVTYSKTNLRGGIYGIFVDLNYECDGPPDPLPIFRDIHLHDLQGDVAYAGVLTCLKDSPCFIEFANIDFTCVEGFTCSYVNQTSKNVYPNLSCQNQVLS